MSFFSKAAYIFFFFVSFSSIDYAGGVSIRCSNTIVREYKAINKFYTTEDTLRIANIHRAARVRADAIIGLDVPALMKKYEIGKLTVYKYLKADDARIDNYGPICPKKIRRETNAALCHMLRAVGLEGREIAEHLGVNRSYVYVLCTEELKRYGTTTVTVKQFGNEYAKDRDGKKIMEGLYTMTQLKDDYLMLRSISGNYSHFCDTKALINHITVKAKAKQCEILTK